MKNEGIIDLDEYFFAKSQHVRCDEIETSTWGKKYKKVLNKTPSINQHVCYNERKSTAVVNGNRRHCIIRYIE